MSEIMIDIETLGISPNSVVMTIGAIKFNRIDDIKSIEYMDSFYCRVSKESCLKLGLEINVCLSMFNDNFIPEYLVFKDYLIE